MPLLVFLFSPFVLAPLCLASDAYLPLDGGNQWTYGVVHSSLGELENETLSIHPAVVKTLPPRYQFDQVLGQVRWLVTPREGSRFHGKKYYVAGEGRGLGQKLYDFTAPVRSAWKIRMSGASGEYEVIQHLRSVEVAGHVFQNVIHLRYLASNTLVEHRVDQWFALNIGMVRQRVYNGGTRDTIESTLEKAVLSGTVAFDASAGSGSGLVTSLSLDRFHYQLNAMPPVINKTYLTMRLAIDNQTGESIPFTYYGGQRFDIILKNSQGKKIWQWSDGKYFTANITNGELKSGQSLKFAETVCLDDVLVGRTSGTYVIEVIHVGTLRASVSQTIQVTMVH